MNQTTGVRSITRKKATKLSQIRSRKASSGSEKGYVMVMTAIMLPLLLVLVSAATDVTYFYARTVEIQRIADSAALAGVVRMPNFPDAKKTAYKVATQNGALTGTNDITVTASQITGTNRQIKVSVRDANVKLFFGRIFKDHWDITRTATAEYVSNIPLGSLLNAIGTGDLTGASGAGTVGAGMRTRSQNFWLTVHGPCAAKEQGDQVSTRYDGTLINGTVAPGNQLDAANKPKNLWYRVCDYNSTQSSMTSDAAYTNRLATIAGETSAANTAAGSTNLFPGVSINREHDPEGYNYIVDVPCTPVGGVVLPAPCPDSDKTLQPINVDVFDPVFNPDSLQIFGNAANKKIKPDAYGVNRTGVSAGCLPSAGAPAVLTACAPAVPAGQTRPADVRVTTNFRVFPADDTPVDYTDDKALTLGADLASTNNRVSGIDANNVAEIDAVAQFKSCINATDYWMDTTQKTDDGSVVGSVAHDYVPDGITVANTPIQISAADPDMESSTGCARNGTQWRTLYTIPSGSRKGRFRINVRTVSAPKSFGLNAFSIRASEGSVPIAPAQATFTWCNNPLTPGKCPSVSGDSTMSVSASVPQVSEFYLAQLSPARLFRGKTVLLQLWDVGEGGDRIEILRPVKDATQCAAGAAFEKDSDPELPGSDCTQHFNWSVRDPGYNEFGASALDPTGDPASDNCTGAGQKDKLTLSVSGRWDTTLVQPFIDPDIGCAVFDPNRFQSRGGFSQAQFPKVGSGSAGAPCEDKNGKVYCEAGRFNDRLVSLEVQIPSTYGCDSGTGTGPTNECVDLEEQKASAPSNPAFTGLPQNGWWKIRYYPLKESSSAAQYLPMTDSTTWSVNLIGDPVHLIPN
jgi:Flp pilus assembly protein TadG